MQDFAKVLNPRLKSELKDKINLNLQSLANFRLTKKVRYLSITNLY